MLIPTEFLISCISRCDAAGLDRLARHCETVDWEAVILAANQQFLVPILWKELCLKQLDEHLPNDVADYLKYISDLNANRNRSLREHTLSACRTLNRVGITPMTLKGVVRLLKQGETPRMFSDIDLMVMPAMGDTAIAALVADGYEICRRYEPHQHTIVDLRHKVHHTQIDLHRGVIEIVGNPLEDPSKFETPLHPTMLCALSSQSTIDGAVVSLPSVDGQIIHTILHDQIQDRGHYNGRFHLSHMYDLVSLVENDLIDGRFIESYFAAHRISSVARTYIYSLKSLFGVDVHGLAMPWWPRLLHQWRMAQMRYAPVAKIGDPVGFIGWEMAHWRYSSKAMRRKRVQKALRDHRWNVLQKLNGMYRK